MACCGRSFRSLGRRHGVGPQLSAMALLGLLDGDDQVRRAWKHVQMSVARRFGGPGEAKTVSQGTAGATGRGSQAHSGRARSSPAGRRRMFSESAVAFGADVGGEIDPRGRPNQRPREPETPPRVARQPERVGWGRLSATGSDPDWEGISAACSSLTTELDEVRLVAATAPDSFTEVGRQLDTYADELAAFSSACDSAVLSQDEPALRSASNHLSAAGDALAELSEMLPPGIGCPDDVPNRPQSCDVPGS